MWKDKWFCRWCGYRYNPKKSTDRDGFCNTKHKQAHHRAYTKYVTALAITNPIAGDHKTGVTQKRQAVKKGIARTTRDLGKVLARKCRKK